MQEQQVSVKKIQLKKNKYLMSQTEQVQKNSQIITNLPYPNEQSYLDEIKKKDFQIFTLKEDNKKLKTKNKQLIKQLQIFSKKLDEEIKKRSIQSQQKKPKIILKPQQKQSLEIQNLYKKIDIYKKEISSLKARYPQQDTFKINQYQSKFNLYNKEISDFKDQIKSLKKIIKAQEKGLADIGVEGFLKISQENQKLKDQIRKLRLQLDQVSRKYRTHHNEKSKIHFNAQEAFNHLCNKQPFQNQAYSKNNLILQRKKYILKGRIKTQPQTTQKQLRLSLQNSTEVNLDKFQQKLEKYQSKMRILTNEKLRQREVIDNLKMQIIQKDKQINYLRDKVQNFRRLPKSKRNKQNQPIVQQDHPNIYLEEIQQIPSRVQSVQSFHQFDKVTVKQHSVYEQPFKQSIPHGVKERETQLKKGKQRYPRLEQKGEKLQTAYKWNHHQFSSKIKQIQVYLHFKGHLQFIHVRYEKGEPNKSSEFQNKKFSALVCGQRQQFIHQIRGGFKNGYLQYLIIKTSTRRVAAFGNTEKENQCENFNFNIQIQEYPCALFGQNSNEGIIRLGCFIDKLPN